jgi:hypothetical protein
MKTEQEIREKLENYKKRISELKNDENANNFHIFNYEVRIRILEWVLNE